MHQSHHNHEYHSLSIADVIDETGDTRSFVLDIPAELTDTFAYEAGQFCTFRATVDGHEVVRCYSMSSSPDAGEPFKTAVKRVPTGVMSNWMNDTLAPGDSIDVLRPAGLFVLHPNPSPIVAFAGGSGITPVISIVKSALLTTDREILLVYANRDGDSVIYGDELEQLRAGSDGRLTVHQPPRRRARVPRCRRVRRARRRPRPRRLLHLRSRSLHGHRRSRDRAARRRAPPGVHRAVRDLRRSLVLRRGVGDRRRW